MRVAVARWPSPQTRTCRTTWASVPIHVRVDWRRMQTAYALYGRCEGHKIAQFWAISLCRANAQAARGQSNLDEECNVGPRDENHRAHKQQRDRPSET